MYDIVIPSNKPIDDLRMMVNAISKMDENPNNYIPTGFNVSASVNRNYGLMQCFNEIIIMMDDDMGGFFPGWQDKLIEPLEQEDNHPHAACM